MKLYDFTPSPSPRRARVFAAEKGIALDLVEVNVRKGEQFADSFRGLSPNCTVPVLELDDGTLLCDSFAIWRYFEDTRPEPPLLGTTALEKAQIEEWLRRIELEGYQAAVEALRNEAERFKDRAVPSSASFAQIPALAERGHKRIQVFFQTLDQRLGESEYVAGPDFSAADIHAMITVDFAAGAIQETPPDGLAALKAWHGKVSARPSAKA